MKITTFWVMIVCSLVKVYWHFRGNCCLHHQGGWLVHISKTARHNIPKDSSPHSHHYGNLKLLIQETCEEAKVHHRGGGGKWGGGK